MAFAGLARFDGDGCLVWANPDFGAVLGCGGAIRTGMPLADVLGAVGQDRARALAAPDVIAALTAGETAVLYGAAMATGSAALALARGEGGETLLTAVPLPAGALCTSAFCTDPDHRHGPALETAQSAIMEAIAFPLVVSRLADGLVLAGNQPAAAMFGIPLADAVGRVTSWEFYTDPDERIRLVARLKEGRGQCDGFETQVRSRGGREAWVMLSARQLVYCGEQALLVCITDLTERRRMEKDLAAQWKQSQAVLEGLSQGVLALDRDRRLTAWNGRVLDLLGLAPGDVVFRMALPRLAEQVAGAGRFTAANVSALLGQGLADGAPLVFEPAGAGGLVMEATARGLPDGGCVITCTDITSRKRAERELRDSRALFEQAIRAARDGISQWDLKSGEVWFSPQWWSLLGYGEDEAVNSIERWAELILPEDRDVSLRAAADFAAGLIEDCQLVQRYQHRAGHTVYLYSRSIKVADDGGQTVKLIGSHTDITERIRAEDTARTAKEQAERALKSLKEAQAHLIQSEKMAALGSLVAGVAHEINTPIGIALTGASLLAERTDVIRRSFAANQLRRPDFADYLETAEEATQLMMLNIDRAAQLIQSFKQMAVDQASEERRVFHLADYIQEVLRSLSVRLKRASHAITVECPPDLVLDSYPGALSQILTNFIMNSLIHGYPPGQTGHLSITVTCDEAEEEVTLRYADDGRGIPAELQDKVFEPFFTTNRGAGGSGLGLNIIYNIATRTLRGRIALDSAPGQGTAFTLRFPRCIPAG